MKVWRSFVIIELKAGGHNDFAILCNGIYYRKPNEYRVEAATKEDLEVTKMVGRLFGIPSSSLTRRKKSMSQKRKLVRSSHLVPTVLGREA